MKKELFEKDMVSVLTCQWTLQNTVMKNSDDTMASSGFLMMSSLAFFDEVFEFRDELQSALSADSQKSAAVSLEYADMLLFLLNIGLWIGINLMISMKKSPSHLVSKALAAGYERRNEGGDPVRALRDFLRSTPWKPWKKSQSFKPDEILVRYEDLAAAYFGLAAEFDFDLDQVFSLYSEKRQIVEDRAKSNY